MVENKACKQHKNKAPILTENIISTTKSQDLDSADQTTPEAADDTDYKYITPDCRNISHTCLCQKAVLM